MAGNTNVSSLIPSNINDTLNKVEKVKAFGDQIPDGVKNKLKISSLGKEADLRIQIVQTTEDIIKLDLNHAINRKNIQDQQQQSSKKIYDKYFPKPPLKAPDPGPSFYTSSLNYEVESTLADLEFDNGKVVFSEKIHEYIVVETITSLDKLNQNKKLSKKLREYANINEAYGNTNPAGLLQIEEKNYLNEKLLLEKQKADLQQKLEDILNDPYKRVKKQRERRQKRVKQRKQRNKTKREREKKRLTLKVLKQAAKTLAPIIALYGTKYLFIIVSNNKKLQDLVDNTNDVISNATTQQDINAARVLRNSTLSILNDNERKILSLQKLIDKINKIIVVFDIILKAIILLFTIPKPFGLGPTMPTPIANKVKKLQDLIFALNIILSILQGMIDAILEDLRDLKSQLQNINDILDNAILNNLSNNELQSFINDIQNQPNDSNTQFPEYKGFKFAIKEEETLGAQQAVVVRGNIKRRYAVAIDRDGVEVLKSEFSFTLDPSDLIEQLKLIIDQRNLQG
jgi:hypothetical protein